MDISIACGNSVSANVNNPDLEQSCVNSKQFTYNTGEDSLVEEFENVLGQFLHIEDVQESVTCSTIPSNAGKICYTEGKICEEELKIDQANSFPLAATTRKSLIKCATFPCSGNMMSASTDGRDEIPGTALHGTSTTKSGNSICARSISMPLELVSAMKGGREKQGITLKKLTVTWDPDVYDPPATSMSHTVRNHNQQRSSRNGKKSSKHKHKGKSSRGSSSDKKQYRKVYGSSDSRLKSAQVPPSDRFFLGGLRQSTVELVDFAVTGQDSKCGSSFLRTSLSKMHISVAEAT